MPANAKNLIRLGMDLGTNQTVLVADENGQELKLKPDIVTSVVGYPRPGVLPGVLPGNQRCYFSDEAIKQRLYLDLKWPLDHGVVVDVVTAREFMRFIRGIVDPSSEKEVRIVVGAPARTEGDSLRTMREAMGDNFDRFLVVPEPFLAALGFRDEAKLAEPGYVDPIRASMVVDIGAGTTDVCFLQGYFPNANEEICVQKAGNNIDLELRRLMVNKYPDAKFHDVSVTQIKEQHSYVGAPPAKIELDLLIHGRRRTLEITDLIGRACAIFIDDIVDAIEELTKRCMPELVEAILGNIIMTGGGSQIRGIGPMVEQKLHARGLTAAKARVAKDYKKLVARGAYRVAVMAREDQWQFPTLS